MPSAHLDDVMLELLAAAGPRQEHRDELMAFGRLLGSWDLEMTAFGPDGSRRSFAGEWHFAWVLEGRAVQDVLITRTPGGELVGYGSTVRSFDAQRGLWWIVWQDPLAGEFAVLLGRPEGDSIVLDGRWSIAANGRRRFRWTFSDITETSFGWAAEISDDEGRAWRIAERISARRAAAAVTS